MNRSDAPTKQGVPFGANGNRTPILPTTPAGDNSASYDVGFPTITMILKSAGGLPPKGQDMNEILYELSALARWGSTGAMNRFDSAFSSAIGGYPQDSQVISDDGNIIWRSLVDNNTNNPNANPSGWIPSPSNPYPVGSPIPWPTATPPSGFLAMTGQSFSATTYPNLALAYPSLILPDMRAITVKGVDAGRGVDPSRVLLSFQAGSLIYGDDNWGGVSMCPSGLNSGNRAASSYGIASPSNYPKAKAGAFTTTTPPGGDAVNFSAAGVAQVDNIAFNYIVRAA